MTRPWLILARTFAAALLPLTASSAISSSQEQTPPQGEPTRAEKAPPAKCCFTNPGYSGTCEVQPAKDESCGQILDYLNGPMSQGKGYCGNTQVRGGWTSVSCEAKKP
jgi:hypothetical protein